MAFGLEERQLSSTAGHSIEELRGEARSRALAVEVLEADVAQAEDVQRVLGHVLQVFGRVDGLVNNAAIGPLGTVLDTSEADFDRIVAVNLRGPYLTSRAVLPHFIAQGGGAIVNIGSGAGWGKHNMAVYSATKAAVHGLTMAMAYDHVAERVRVNLVIPGGGGIITGMSLGRTGGDVAKAGAGPGTVAGRPATGDDVAKVVAFLLSNDAEVISGTVVDVGCFAGQGGPWYALQDASGQPLPTALTRLGP